MPRQQVLDESGERGPRVRLGFGPRGELVHRGQTWRKQRLNEGVPDRLADTAWHMYSEDTDSDHGPVESAYLATVATFAEDSGTRSQ